MTVAPARAVRQREKCPNPFIPSCETQQALAQCLKQVVCDVLRCLAHAVTPPPPTGKNTLSNCLLTAVATFAECVPDALCGPRTTPPTTAELPCDFAVEEELSVNPVSAAQK
jgi:hypothetical protein